MKWIKLKKLKKKSIILSMKQSAEIELSVFSIMTINRAFEFFFHSWELEMTTNKWKVVKQGNTSEQPEPVLKTSSSEHQGRFTEI